MLYRLGSVCPVCTATPVCPPVRVAMCDEAFWPASVTQAFLKATEAIARCNWWQQQQLLRLQQHSSVCSLCCCFMDVLCMPGHFPWLDSVTLLGHGVVYRFIACLTIFSFINVGQLQFTSLRIEHCSVYAAASILPSLVHASILAEHGCH